MLAVQSGHLVAAPAKMALGPRRTCRGRPAPLRRSRYPAALGGTAASPFIKLLLNLSGPCYLLLWASRPASAPGRGGWLYGLLIRSGRRGFPVHPVLAQSCRPGCPASQYKCCTPALRGRKPRLHCCRPWHPPPNNRRLVAEGLLGSPFRRLSLVCWPVFNDADFYYLPPKPPRKWPPPVQVPFLSSGRSIVRPCSDTPGPWSWTLAFWGCFWVSVWSRTAAKHLMPNYCKLAARSRRNRSPLQAYTQADRTGHRRPPGCRSCRFSVSISMAAAWAAPGGPRLVAVLPGTRYRLLGPPESRSGDF